jgi:hypothetical protein
LSRAAKIVSILSKGVSTRSDAARRRLSRPAAHPENQASQKYFDRNVGSWTDKRGAYFLTKPFEIPDMAAITHAV